MKKKLVRKKKLLKFLKDMGVLFAVIIVGGIVVWFKSVSANYKSAFLTKRELIHIACNDTVPKGIELNKNIAEDIILKLDSIKFKDTAAVEVDLFENKYFVRKMSDSFFCVKYNNNDSIILQKLNDKRIQAMNGLYYEMYVDPINEVYER